MSQPCAAGGCKSVATWIIAIRAKKKEKGDPFTVIVHSCEDDLLDFFKNLVNEPESVATPIAEANGIALIPGSAVSEITKI